MKVILTVLVLALVSACSKFETEEALFVGYNASSDPIELYVNNGPGYKLGANGTSQFSVTIQVPTKRVNDYGGPSSVDKIVDVSISAKNLRTGLLMPHQMCQAGAKMITHITYELSQYGYESLRCTHSYPY